MRKTAVTASILMCFAAAEAGATDAICNRTFPITVGADTLQQVYCANVDLEAANADVTKLVVLIHGTSRTSQHYTRDLIPSAGEAGVSTSVSIIAPQFIRDDDNGMPFVDETDTAVGGTLDLNVTHGDYLYYGAGWIEGDESWLGTGQGWAARPFIISSYETLDRMIAEAVANYPNLRKIIITGHSAGGQFVNRYVTVADLGAFPEELTVFAPVNPSSSIYFDAQRPDDPVSYPITFSTPVPADCDGSWLATGELGQNGFSGFAVGSVTNPLTFVGVDFTEEYTSRRAVGETQLDDAISGTGEFAFFYGSEQVSPTVTIDGQPFSVELYSWASLSSALRADPNATIHAEITTEPTSGGGSNAPDIVDAYLTISDQSEFSSYNEYKYAMVDVSPADNVCDNCAAESDYMGNQGFSGLTDNFDNRNIVRMIALDDNDPNEASIAQTCPNHLQGEQRLARAEAYIDHVVNAFGWGKLVNNYEALYIAGCDHSGQCAWNSNCGRYFLWNDPAHAAECADRSTFSDAFSTDLSQWTAGGTGDGSITLSGNQRVDGAFSAQFDGNTSSGTLTLTSNVISATGVHTASWGWWLGSRADAGEDFVAEINVDGGGWTEVARISGDAADTENLWLYNGTTVNPSSTMQFRFSFNADAPEEEAILDEFTIFERRGL